jgi:hypothetical protein
MKCRYCSTEGSYKNINKHEFTIHKTEMLDLNTMKYKERYDDVI